MTGDYLSKQEYKSTTNVLIVTVLISVVGLIIYNLIINKHNNK